VSCDLLSLILQAAGGAITSIADADQQSLAQTGVNIMIAGLASQVASLVLFMVLCLDFAWRVKKSPMNLNDGTRDLRSQLRWKLFLGGKSPRILICDFCSFRSLFTNMIYYVLPGLALATITIFARSVFRMIELNGGFHSALANNEVDFMVLEGAMIVIAILCLTALHPGVCFDGMWDQTKWSFKGTKNNNTNDTTNNTMVNLANLNNKDGNMSRDSQFTRDSRFT
jgi:hypothetical protein